MTKKNNNFSSKIRVRIAPSPTGKLHIGTARVALFNFLWAKNQGGRFILRIEDTDLERSDPQFERDIIENLKWLGIKWDEGPDVGGPFAPYRQSHRLETYAHYIKKLLEEDKIYRCFCTKEELEAQRQNQLSIGRPPVYTGKCRKLSRATVRRYLAEGKPYIFRFKTPHKIIKFRDMIRGNIEYDCSLLGDFSIAKNLAAPLYNFAVVVDDFEMKITHVIRGEDHIPNTPKQILLQEALGFPHPKYAHLPLILGEDKSKLSKRHGATAISEYKEKGYLPEAMVNFMALLGWNPGTDKEIYTLEELIKEFSLARVQKSSAVFDIKKLDWINGFYIRRKPLDKLTKLCIAYLIKSGFIKKLYKSKYEIKDTKEIVDLKWIEKIISIYRERLKKLSEISELTDYFFKDKLEYDKELLVWKNMSCKEVKVSLDKAHQLLSDIKEDAWKETKLKTILLAGAEKWGSDRGCLLWPLRAALTGKRASAAPFEIAAILGKKKTLKRIEEAKDII